MSYLIDYLSNSSWKRYLRAEFEKPSFRELEKFLQQELKRGKTLYPPQNKIFSAFNLLPPEQIKILILGQDPYHQPGQAQGVAFSVSPEIQPPPSLRNILQEVRQSTGQNHTSKGDLTIWVEQGVMLLNTVMTVEQGRANSHQKKGWEDFTDRVIITISELPQPVIFLLWGRSAQQKEGLIDPQKNRILKSTHPSPLSAYRGFLGCNHFVLANQILVKNGQSPVKW